MDLNDYSKLLKKLKYSKHFYTGKKKKEIVKKLEKNLDEPFMDSEALYAYLESEIPVYLVFKWNDLRKELKCGKPSKDCHTVVAIGHTMNKNGIVSKFIIHDVSCAPFLEISKKMVDNNLLEALVLLPKDVNMRYENVRRVLIKIIMMYTTLFDNISKENQIIIHYRPFLMRSQRIKFWYTNKELYPTSVRSMFSQADFPRYVWVFEIGTPELKKKNRCIGQIIIDASKPKKGMGLVLMNFPKFRLWSQNNELCEESLETPIFEDLPLFRDPLYARERSR